jgi:hypothetical protein
MFEKTNGINDQMEQDEVLDYIRYRLNDDTYAIPNELYLKQLVTSEMSSVLRVRKKRVKNINYYYPLTLRSEWQDYIDGNKDLEETLEENKVLIGKIKAEFSDKRSRKEIRKKEAKKKKTQEKDKLHDEVVKNIKNEKNKKEVVDGGIDDYVLESPSKPENADETLEEQVADEPHETWKIKGMIEQLMKKEEGDPISYSNLSMAYLDSKKKSETSKQMKKIISDALAWLITNDHIEKTDDGNYYTI